MARQVVGAVRVICVLNINGTNLAIIEREGVENGISVVSISQDVFDFLRFIGVPECSIVTPQV